MSKATQRLTVEDVDVKAMCSELMERGDLRFIKTCLDTLIEESATTKADIATLSFALGVAYERKSRELEVGEF